MIFNIVFGIWCVVAFFCYIQFDPEASKEHQIYWQNRFLYCLTILAIMVIISKFV